MGTNAQGQQPWIEGSRGSLTLGFTGDAVGQQDVVNIAGDMASGFPRNSPRGNKCSSRPQRTSERAGSSAC